MGRKEPEPSKMIKNAYVYIYVYIYIYTVPNMPDVSTISRPGQVGPIRALRVDIDSDGIDVITPD